MSAELTTLWARTLLHAARVSGVRDVIASPGSRSTPFVAAALAESGLAVRAVVDERSAAFFAVGQAKITGRPSLLIATSGSAATHYAPAVAEAAATHTPLLVLTADRPPELHDAGAFDRATVETSTADTVSRLVTAACRPITEPGKMFASEAFACAEIDVSVNRER